MTWCFICFKFWVDLDRHLRFVHREEVVMTIGGKK